MTLSRIILKACVFALATTMFPSKTAMDTTTNFYNSNHIFTNISALTLRKRADCKRLSSRQKVLLEKEMQKYVDQTGDLDNGETLFFSTNNSRSDSPAGSVDTQANSSGTSEGYISSGSSTFISDSSPHTSAPPSPHTSAPRSLEKKRKRTDVSIEVSVPKAQTADVGTVTEEQRIVDAKDFKFSFDQFASTFQSMSKEQQLEAVKQTNPVDLMNSMKLLLPLLIRVGGVGSCEDLSASGKQMLSGVAAKMSEMSSNVISDENVFAIFKAASTTNRSDILRNTILQLPAEMNAYLAEDLSKMTEVITSMQACPDAVSLQLRLLQLPAMQEPMMSLMAQVIPEMLKMPEMAPFLEQARQTLGMGVTTNSTNNPTNPTNSLSTIAKTPSPVTVDQLSADITQTDSEFATMCDDVDFAASKLLEDIDFAGEDFLSKVMAGNAEEANMVSLTDAKSAMEERFSDTIEGEEISRRAESASTESAKAVSAGECESDKAGSSNSAAGNSSTELSSSSDDESVTNENGRTKRRKLDCHNGSSSEIKALHMSPKTPKTGAVPTPTAESTSLAAARAADSCSPMNGAKVAEVKKVVPTKREAARENERLEAAAQQTQQ